MKKTVQLRWGNVEKSRKTIVLAIIYGVNEMENSRLCARITECIQLFDLCDGIDNDSMKK